MRKIAIIEIILIFLSLSTPNPAYSAQQDTPLQAIVTVNPVFKISLQTSMLDFGVVEPGALSPKKNISISCVTNNNRPWSVSVYAQSPLTYNVHQIPLPNLKWESQIINGTGQAVPSGEINLTPVNFYQAGLKDYITETPVELLLSFSVDIPSAQVAGQYSTVLVITMYEE